MQRDASIRQRPGRINVEDIGRWFRRLGCLNVAINQLYSRRLGLIQKSLGRELIAEIENKGRRMIGIEQVLVLPGWNR